MSILTYTRIARTPFPHSFRSALPTSQDRAPADSESSPEIAAPLLGYLRNRLGLPSLRYRERPTVVTDGWETHIFHFALETTAGLPAEYCEGLTLRLFGGRQAVERGRREFAVQSRLEQAGYPVPEPVCWEEDCDILGGPFQIMEHVAGPTLMERLIYRPWALLPIADCMAEMQCRLHRVPPSFCPASPRPLLDRTLDEIRDGIEAHGLHGLKPGLAWLHAHRPAPPRTPSILHLDFHPFNVIHRPGSFPVVLDWDAADIGDPHADIATTAMLLSCAPNEGKNLWEQTMIATGRDMLYGLYLFSCGRRMTVNDFTLAYYKAWTSLRRLARYGRCMRCGPQETGRKPAYMRHLRHGHVEKLCRLFRRITGVKVVLHMVPCEHTLQ